jgi:hypothetical protein
MEIHLMGYWNFEKLIRKEEWGRQSGRLLIP